MYFNVLVAISIGLLYPLLLLSTLVRFYEPSIRSILICFADMLTSEQGKSLHEAVNFYFCFQARATRCSLSTLVFMMRMVAVLSHSAVRNKCAYSTREAQHSLTQRCLDPLPLCGKPCGRTAEGTY